MANAAGRQISGTASVEEPGLQVRLAPRRRVGGKVSLIETLGPGAHHREDGGRKRNQLDEAPEEEQARRDLEGSRHARRNLIHSSPPGQEEKRETSPFHQSRGGLGNRSQSERGEGQEEPDSTFHGPRK